MNSMEFFSPHQESLPPVGLQRVVLARSKTTLRASVSPGVHKLLESLFPVKNSHRRLQRSLSMGAASSARKAPLTRHTLNQLPKAQGQSITHWIDCTGWQETLSAVVVERVVEGCGQFDLNLTPEVVESRRQQRLQQEQELQEARKSPERLLLMQADDDDDQWCVAVDHLQASPDMLLGEINRLARAHPSGNVSPFKWSCWSSRGRGGTSCGSCNSSLGSILDGIQLGGGWPDAQSSPQLTPRKADLERVDALEL